MNLLVIDNFSNMDLFQFNTLRSSPVREVGCILFYVAFLYIAIFLVGWDSLVECFMYNFDGTFMAIYDLSSSLLNFVGTVILIAGTTIFFIAFWEYFKP